jgi:two-component system phosphate regulon sensor histidine kinase PhoR
MEKRSLNRILILLNLLNLVLLTILLVLKLPVQFVLLAMLGSTAFILVFTLSSLHLYLGKIASAVKEIGRGNGTRRIPELDVEEFDSMGRSLNLMLGQLDSTIGHLSVHREELRLLLDSIGDALWSQDGEGRIMWANDSFASLFPGYQPGEKQYAWELIRDPELSAFIGKAGGKERRRMLEVQIEDHSFLLLASHNPQADRTVFILQNIDPIRQAQQMKRDFIVNLAHELRTPLTAIKGFSEALQEDAGGDQLRYLNIIRNHSLRLIHLVEDLESLIQLERRADIKPQDVHLGTFFENLRQVLEPMLESSGLSLETTLAEGLERAVLDPFRFEQVFINLVENSVRYTASGGVSIRVAQENGNLVFKVCDTGSGIPEQHLGRIFERFYVADPSRSRARSGTGLGLSIVKHIVLLHNGTISVKSAPGKGTCFLITIPAQ